MTEHVTVEKPEQEDEHDRLCEVARNLLCGHVQILLLTLICVKCIIIRYHKLALFLRQMRSVGGSRGGREHFAVCIHYPISGLTG